MFLAVDSEFVTGGSMLKKNGLEHCFLAPAKLPRSAILNNGVDKIVTAIQKIVEIALVSAKPTRKWRHTVKIWLQVTTHGTHIIQFF